MVVGVNAAPSSDSSAKLRCFVFMAAFPYC